ncbi:uncharacterized protein [Euwallacea fornicatus]|uniref:uncharacterized protein n=1 Tax=Euwallacea fornicatus TaxID=995702 RepID=UPI00338D5ED6
MGGLTALLISLLAVTSLTYGSAQNFIDSDLKDLLQIGGDVNVTQVSDGRSARQLGNASFEDNLENFVKSNELSMEAPFGTTVTFSGRNLDSGEVSLKLRLDSESSEVQARKKAKIKKILPPILIILLLKAITFIPLALGVLGIKTWNALQLSFVSFVTSIVLAVWKLCAKFSDHHHAPHIIHEAVHDVHIPHVYHDNHHDHHVVHHDHHLDHFDDHHYHHHDPWEHAYHRSDEGGSQQVAYGGYSQEIKA